MTFSEIQSRINNAKALDFGTIFNQSIELFKKSWLQGFLVQLFVIILILPFILVFYVPFLMMVITQSENGQVDPNTFSSFFAGFSLLYLVLFFVGILAVSVIQVALNAAFFRILKRLDDGEQVKTSDLFYFLKGKYIGNIIVLMFASIIIAIAFVLLCYFPIFYAMIPLSFFTIMFAFNPEMSITEIVKLCFSIGTKKWLITFGLTFVSSLLASLIGFLMCGVGTLFTAAFVYHPLYFIYKEVIGFDTNEQISTIENEVS
jgi:hypothetical protein